MFDIRGYVSIMMIHRDFIETMMEHRHDVVLAKT